jgi:3-dehydroquinate synthase
MQSIKSTGYKVHFNSNAYKELIRYLSKNQNSKMFIIVDENTFIDCYPIFMEQLEVEIDTEVIEIEAGEIHKNIETCSGLWNVLTELGADRKSLIVNLGGGVITDMGGFVASTYKRGISFINVPTTLLSMVDASVGGKTGVDLGVLKNQIGLFSNPEMVLIDSRYLETVSEREIKSGLAEVIKYGLVNDNKLWVQLRDSNELNINLINSMIYDSITIKNKIVIEDPKENSLRKTLNFGHTLGHAIESYFLESEDKETLTHGEAIAAGMITESYISYKILDFPLDKLTEVKQTILDIFGLIDLKSDDYKEILSLLKHDKKNINGNVNFVLLSDFEKYK